MSLPKMDETFTISMPEAVYSRWEELGITEEQKNDDISDIKVQINKIIGNYLENLTLNCKSAREEINNIKLSQRKAMIAFGSSEEEVKQAIAAIEPINLLQQLAEAKTSYENFQALCADRIKKLETLVHLTGQLFDTLGTPIEERGEFNEIGDTDYSRERLDRFKDKVEELQQEIDQRKQTVASIREEISNIQKEICVKLSTEENDVLNTESLTDEAIDNNKKLLDKIKTSREERVALLNTYAVRMMHLWNLLEIPVKKRNEFIKKYSTISDEVIEDCKAEIRELEKERDEKLPVLIQQQRSELESLYSTLHVAVEGRMIIDDDITDEEKVEEQFNKMEEEIIRLKDIAVEIHPILVTIKELEEIESNFADVQKEHDPKSYTSRDRSCALQLMKEEKARRRYKVIRPKVQKKLLGLLQQYKKEKGVDLEWDGYPYIDRLKQSENNEKIVQRFNKITNCGSVPIVKKRVKRSENANQEQCYAASVRPVSARRKMESKHRLY